MWVDGERHKDILLTWVVFLFKGVHSLHFMLVAISLPGRGSPAPLFECSPSGGECFVYSGFKNKITHCHKKTTPENREPFTLMIEHHMHKTVTTQL